MNINKRLRRIADYVLHDDKFIDVGCDHAFLSIVLLLEKNITRAIASDIHEGPLKIALENIEEYNIEDRIKVKLGDGLDPIEDFIDTVIISGMGGITIADIMTNKEKLKNIKKMSFFCNIKFWIIKNCLTYLHLLMRFALGAGFA